MQTRYVYPVRLAPDRDGSVTVSFPDLPEALTQGETAEEALTQAIDCLEEALANRIATHAEIPAPSPARGRPTVAPGAVVASKAALYEAMHEQRIRNADLARGLHLGEAEVRRMLDPHHATKIARLEEALAYLGRRLTIVVEAS